MSPRVRRDGSERVHRRPRPVPHAHDDIRRCRRRRPAMTRVDDSAVLEGDDELVRCAVGEGARVREHPLARVPRDVRAGTERAGVVPGLEGNIVVARWIVRPVGTHGGPPASDDARWGVVHGHARHHEFMRVQRQARHVPRSIRRRPADDRGVPLHVPSRAGDEPDVQVQMLPPHLGEPGAARRVDVHGCRRHPLGYRLCRSALPETRLRAVAHCERPEGTLARFKRLLASECSDAVRSQCKNLLTTERHVPHPPCPT